MNNKSQTRIMSIFLISFLIIISLICLVVATITASGTTAQGWTADLADGMTWNHEFTCGSDMVLIVGIAIDADIVSYVDTIKYNGTDLSLVGRETSSDDEEQVEMWNLSNPDCGASLPIVVTFSDSGDREESAGGSVVFYGVDSVNLSTVTKLGCASASCTSSSIVVPAQAGDVVVDVIAVDVDPLLTYGGNQTVLINYDAGVDAIGMSYGNVTGTSLTMSWTWNNDEHAHIGVALISVPTVDETKPTYSNAQTNNTQAVLSTLFSIQYNDNTALHPNGQYIFSTNNTGTWVNESAVNFTATPNWANVTKTLNSTVGLSIGYRWFADDNAGNINNTGIFTLTTTGSECSPTLNVDWDISDSQVCDAKSVTTGTGSINILSGGTLYLINSANIITNQLNLKTTGDQVFINSGSEIRVG